MAKIDLNSRLVGSGSTDTLTCYGLEVYQGGIKTRSGQVPVVNVGTSSTYTTAGAGTYTATMLFSGLILRDPNGAGRTDTTDTAANIIAGTPGLSADGDSFLCMVVNTADAAETITLAGGTGVTINNPLKTIIQDSGALLLIRRLTSTTVDISFIGVR